MTPTERAKKINDLLKKAVDIQNEAKRINGRDCFNMKSIKVLKSLQYQIESAFTQIANEA